jgi:hypothetical protein
MLKFKVKKLENIKFDTNELVEYFHKLETDYQHLKWTVPDGMNKLTHKVDNMYSWAIQSNMKDPSKPCPPYHIENKEDSDLNDSFQVPTELIFGFGKKIVDSFPNIRQTVITCHPPNTFIDQHIDSDNYVKVHIPIKTNKNSYFIFEDEKFNLEVGNAYLVNTALMHGTDNQGDSDRIHLIFKITEEDALHLMETEYILDHTLLDFDVLELPNFKFNYQDLNDFYQIVNTNFEHLKWSVPKRDLSKDQKLFPPGYDDSIGIFGYAIQSNLKDPDVPAPVYNVKTIPKELKLPYATNKTKLYFGFAKQLLDNLPFIEELVITGHPAKSKIHLHRDNDVNIRIHLPIIINKESYFIFEEAQYILEPGKAYLINTNRLHGTDNQGDCDRVHLFFKIPIGRIKEIMKGEIKI